MRADIFRSDPELGLLLEIAQRTLTNPEAKILEKPVNKIEIVDISG